MTADEWNALADRVHVTTFESDEREAENHRRLLGADILKALGYHYAGRFLYGPDGGLLFRVPDMLRSVDDALTTIPTDGSITLLDISFGWEPSDAAVYPAASARWYPPRKSGIEWYAKVVTAATLALTITETGLRLRAEQVSQLSPGSC